MKKKYTIAITSVVVVLTTLAILLGSCSMGQGDFTSETGIRLSIGPDTPSRIIEVETIDVTKVVVRIDIPGMDDHVIEWFEGDDPYSDFIPIAEPGTYQISVTHYGEKDGEPVEITETDDLPVYPMLITFVRIVPGMVGKIDVDPGEGPEPVDLTGAWDLYYYGTPYGDIGPLFFPVEQTGTDLLAGLGYEGFVDGTYVFLESFTVPETGHVVMEGEYFAGEVSGGAYLPDPVSGELVQLGTFTMMETAEPIGYFKILGTAIIDPDGHDDDPATNDVDKVPTYLDYESDYVLIDRWYEENPDTGSQVPWFYINGMGPNESFSMFMSFVWFPDVFPQDFDVTNDWYTEAWFSIEYFPVEEPENPGWVDQEVTGILRITRYDDNGIAGEFIPDRDLGHDLEFQFDFNKGFWDPSWEDPPSDPSSP